MSHQAACYKSGAVGSLFYETASGHEPEGVTMPDPKPVSVVIVDDHPVVRDGLCAMISAETDIQVVAGIGTGAEALAIIPKLRPTVVLMDLLLPDIGGSEVI